MPGSVSAAEFSRLHELMYELKVEQVMTRQLLTVGPDDTMRAVKEILRTARLSGAPVVEKGRLVGIVSVADVIHALETQAIDRSVAESMTRAVVTVQANEVLAEAIKKFARYSFGRLPVLDASGALVGIVTPTDINGRLLLALERRTREEERRSPRIQFALRDLVSDDTRIVLRYFVKAHDMDRAGEASTQLKKALTRLGVNAQEVRRTAIAAYEAEMNLAIHSMGGWLAVEVTPQRITVTASDDGPGIENVERALEPGFSTAPDWIRELGFGAGMGLTNIQRSANEFHIHSEIGRGTTVWAAVNLEGKS